MTKSRPTKAEVELRVLQVYKFVKDGLRREQILTIVNGKLGWDVTVRQLGTYLARARARFEEDSKVVQKAELGKAIARLDTQYCKADQRKDHRGAMMIESKRIELLGLAKPARVEITVTDEDRRKVEADVARAIAEAQKRDPDGGD